MATQAKWLVAWVAENKGKRRIIYADNWNALIQDWMNALSVIDEATLTSVSFVQLEPSQNKPKDTVNAQG